jgi:hypothetical protein
MKCQKEEKWIQNVDALDGRKTGSSSSCNFAAAAAAQTKNKKSCQGLNLSICRQLRGFQNTAGATCSGTKQT